MHYTERDLEAIITEYFTVASYPYAFLLTGAWGTGKTYFVRSYFLHKQSEINDKRIVYLSLYGLSSGAELRERIYDRILSVKLGAGNWTLLSSGASFALGTALSAVGMKLDSKVFDDFIEKVKKLALTPKDYLFIFDDVERTLIPTREWMGVVSNLLELYETKVLLIANENEIDKTQSDSYYKKEKEKIIGRTIVYAPTFAERLDSLLDNDLYKCLQSHQKDVEQIMAAWNCENLRYVEFANNIFILLDRKITYEQKKKLNDYPNKIEPYLIKCILHMTIAFQLGRAKLDESKWDDQLFAYQSYYQEEEHLYPSMNKVLLAFKFVEDYIYDSFVDTGVINKTLDQFDAYLQEEAWRTDDPLYSLKNYPEMEEAEVEKQLELLQQNFRQGKYSLQDYYHVFYYLKILNTIGFIDADLAKAEKQAIDNIEKHNYRDKTVMQQPLWEADEIKKQFPVIWQRIQVEKENQRQSKLEEEINQMLSQSAETAKVAQWIRGRWVQQPYGIFCYIDPLKFVRYIRAISNKDLYKLCGAISYISHQEELNKYLVNDAEPVFEIIRQLQENNFQDKIKAYHIKNLCEILQKIYDRIIALPV